MRGLILYSEDRDAFMVLNVEQRGMLLTSLFDSSVGVEPKFRYATTTNMKPSARRREKLAEKEVSKELKTQAHSSTLKQTQAHSSKAS